MILWTLRARWGLPAVVMECNLGGLAIIVVELWLAGFLGRLTPDWPRAMAEVSIYPALGAAAGIVLAIRDRSRCFGWLDEGRAPDEAEARRLLHLPAAITFRALAIWLPGVIIAAVIFARVTDWRSLPVVLGIFAIGAVQTAGFTFLFVDRMLRPTIPAVSVVLRGTTHWSSTVLIRVVMSWIVSGAMPMLMVITVLADRDAGAHDRIRTGIYLAVIGIGAGAVATAALARAVAVPLRLLRRALDRIAHGDLEVRVPVGSTSEIGRLEHSVNELAANLRERERMRDVFGRHVGTEVAERALAGSMDLTGEMCVVTALFVDVIGSVERSTELAPREFVAQLNRLLSIVVSATEANGGLVNKFEGDAALCIFGTPIEQADNATPALRAARRIRDEVAALGELEVGIGVARGLVFAGDVGTDTRLEFTVIGDAVNEAARLTTEAKRVARRILVSQDVIEAAAPGEQTHWAHYETIHLRGRKTPTACWTDTAPTPKPPTDTGPALVRAASEPITPDPNSIPANPQSAPAGPDPAGH
jgi:adenylate cyclase